MKKTGIAELKAHLSEYLRAVRGGEEVLVLDRDTPVAKLIPSDGKGRVVVRHPVAGSPLPGKLKFPPALELARDPVELLLEDRSRR
jgi:prevent-host-death family protein